jgi:hypothetical protein
MTMPRLRVPLGTARLLASALFVIGAAPVAIIASGQAALPMPAKDANVWYQLQADGQLYISGGNKQFVQEPANRWRDAAGSWFRLQGGELWASDNGGVNWVPSTTGRWKGSDGKWYRLGSRDRVERSSNGQGWIVVTDRSWPAGVSAAASADDEPMPANLFTGKVLKAAWAACSDRLPRSRGRCIKDYVSAHGVARQTAGVRWNGTR